MVRLEYCPGYRLKHKALSSGSRDYDVDYPIGRFVLGLLCLAVIYEGVSKSPRIMLITRKSLVVH